ncbi:hypothetical protein ACWIUD_10080 [Helicobacter sp. 23-1044]
MKSGKLTQSAESAIFSSLRDSANLWRLDSAIFAIDSAFCGDSQNLNIFHTRFCDFALDSAFFT